jgi:gliding motility-associated-like protein
MKFTIQLKLVIIIFLFSSQLSLGQLSNFALTVTKTNETCTSNGTLNFSVSNTTVGAIIIYSIYQLPDLITPISVQNTTSLGGLQAATYRVVATQSLGNLSNSQQQDVTINNQIVLLSYGLSGDPEICGGDGTIEVDVLTGNPVSYEIFAGPIIKPLQASNLFTGLIEGQYQVRVFDMCGEGVVQTYSVTSPPDGAGLEIEILNNINFIDCTTSDILINISNAPSALIKYPLDVTIIVQNPNGGSPNVYNQIITSGSQNISFHQDVILYAGQTYEISVNVIDGCGNLFEYETLANTNITPLFIVDLIECDLWDLFINGAISAQLISAPSSFTNPLPYDLPSQDDGTFYLNNLQAGIYQILVTDICNGQTLYNVILEETPNFFNTPTYPGCELGMGSVFLYNTVFPLTSAIVTSAPSSYPYPIPHDISNLLTPFGSIYLDNVPAGFYTFSLVNSCGDQANKTVNVIGYQETTNVNVLQNCGSFDIDLHHTSNSQVFNVPVFYLQQYDPLLNVWVNPLTGSQIGGIVLTNNAINYNFDYTGQFRIVKEFYAFNLCNDVIYEFVFDGLPKINDVYSFLCNNGTYDVFVDAVGYQPLIYRIIEKNGQPFLIQNSNENVFLGLEGAIYNFQVEDSCGNILNSVFEVPSPFEFGVGTNGFCDGQFSSFTVPYFSIFQYQWWKNNDTSIILSTTNTLEFPSFNPASDAGVYHVRVWYTGNPNSCIDFVLDFTISPNATNPNAGQNNEVAYCGNQGIIDLFSLLQGSYDSGGEWSELTNSGTLNNNLWNSSTVATGNYQFQYHVDGFCSTSDDAIVTITIKSLPQTPIASVNPINCNFQDLNLFATYIPNVVYNWNGPNNFVSIDQNPVISSATTTNSGTYTVSVSENGCQSGLSSVEVIIENLPNFELESYCQNSNYIISATPQNSTSTYNWVGPNNFSSSENPITITNLSIGSYQVTVTNSEGCSLTKSIEIQSTICEIQNFISPNDDEFNDFFNLAGFDVEKLEIYNRWGKLVYNQNDYINQWHGQNNVGKILPDSTYYYFAYLRSGEVKHGWVFVVH